MQQLVISTKMPQQKMIGLEGTAQCIEWGEAPFILGLAERVLYVIHVYMMSRPQHMLQITPNMLLPMFPPPPPPPLHTTVRKLMGKCSLNCNKYRAPKAANQTGYLVNSAHISVIL